MKPQTHHDNDDVEVDSDEKQNGEEIEVDEELQLLLSDGIYKGDESEYLLIEVENSLIDFNEIIESELNSIKSDYHICENCLQYGDNFEKEF